jgi:hypothetical protein
MSNKVTQEQIDKLLDNAIVEEQTFHGREFVASYSLQDRYNFTVTGRAACVDPDNFDIEIGRKLAREDAARQLWKLEGYLLAYRLDNRV